MSNDELIERITAMLPKYYRSDPDDVDKLLTDCRDALTDAEARIKELERGEYICNKCGLRKDADFEKGDF